MADQISIQIPKTVVNEGSTFTAEVKFRDRATASASVPTTVEYRLYNKTLHQVIRNWTGITAASEVSIVVDAGDNRIRDGSNARENMNIVVVADRGLATEVQTVRRYQIADIKGDITEDQSVASNVTIAGSDRSIRAPDSDTSPNMLLPIAGSRASQLLGFDINGNVELYAQGSGGGGTNLSRQIIGGYLWPQTASELADGVTPTDLAYEPGNILRYGADPTGVSDSSPAVQIAMDLDHNVKAPAGDFLISSTVTITKPKLINCEGNWFARVVQGDSAVGEHTRFVVATDINMFSIQSESVWFLGGMYHNSATTPTKGIFYYPLVCNGNLSGGPSDFGGWSGGIRGAFIYGTRDQIQAGINSGGIGIEFEFTGQTVNWAYWYFMYFDVVLRNFRYGVYMNERDETYNQTANNGFFKLEAQSVKCVIHNPGSFQASDYEIIHQGFSCFSTEAEAQTTPSIYLRGTKHYINKYRPYDFRDTASSGFYHNQKTYDIISGDFVNREWNRIDALRAINYEGDHAQQTLRSPDSRSILPRNGNSGVFIPELHDQLMGAVLAGSVSVGVYQGDDVISSDAETDFTALTDSSANEGIAVSTDLTVADEDNLFKYYDTGLVWMSMTWNAQAVTDDDYVEIVIDGGFTHILDNLIIPLGAGSGLHPKYIHVLRGEIGGVMGDNIFLTVEDMDEPPVGPRYYEFDLGGAGVADLIIRFIGLSDSSGGALSFQQAWGRGQFLRVQNPMMSMHGGEMYGDISFDGNSVGMAVKDNDGNGVKLRSNGLWGAEVVEIISGDNIVSFDGVSNHILYRSNVGLTADSGSSQGDGLVTAIVNVYSTVATTGDAATLPQFFKLGAMIHIKNDGANAMDVFPYSGDDLGAGSNTAVPVAAGSGACFIATVANSTWTQLY